MYNNCFSVNILNKVECPIKMSGKSTGQNMSDKVQIQLLFFCLLPNKLKSITKIK